MSGLSGIGALILYESTVFSTRDIMCQEILPMTQKENEADVVILSGCSE